MIKRILVPAIVLACSLAANSCFAQIGAAEAGHAKAGYDPATGAIWISANNIANWYVQSATDALTGGEPTFPTVAGSLLTNNNARVGQGSFGTPLQYVDAQVGPVVAVGTPISDLKLFSSAALGSPEVEDPIEALGPVIPEPASAALAGLAGLGLIAVRRKR